jgi:phosphoribosylglycinamide formyltransferase-1
MTYRIAVLASGRGSNLQALIDAIEAGILPVEIVGAFSDRPDAPALRRAGAAGIATTAIRPRDFATRLEYDAALFARIDAVQPDLIVCAGYMRLVSEPTVEAHRGRMINIHPSLLPAFKGLRTHEQALEAGAPVHGASVHYVTPELDGGPVIAQARVPVLADDDAATLGARVLEREHPLLVATLRLLAERRVALGDAGVELDAKPIATPLQLDATGRLVPSA